MIFEAEQGDLSKLLTPRQRSMLAKRILLLRDLGGWGEVRLIFKDGQVTAVQLQAESLVRDQPDVESN